MKTLESIEQDNCMEAALGYAEREWRVLPIYGMESGRCTCGNASCGSPGKHPRIGKWPELASTDLQQVKEWWSKWPTANVGIATGEESDLLVIDVDGDLGGRTLAELMETWGWTADTLTANTGKGQHFYFRYPQVKVKGTPNKFPGIDIRSGGNYVVAPPSKHVSGKRYEWLNVGHAVSGVPQCWLDALVVESMKPVSVDPAEMYYGEIIYEGTRNNTLFRIGCGMRGKGATHDEILLSLMTINQERCRPTPLEPTEVENLAASASKYQPKRTNSLGVDSPLWWFDFDVNDWFTNQEYATLLDYQQGWLINLMANCWMAEGKLPTDKNKLAMLARASDRDRFHEEMGEVLKHFLPTRDGSFLVHTGLAKKWLDKFARIAKMRENGMARGKNHRAATAKKANRAMARAKTAQSAHGEAA